MIDGILKEMGLSFIRELSNYAIVSTSPNQTIDALIDKLGSSARVNGNKITSSGKRLCVVPPQYFPNIPGGSDRRLNIDARVAIAQAITDCIKNTSESINVRFHANKSMISKRVTTIKIDSIGMNDITLIGSKLVPIAVQLYNGTYYHHIDDDRVINDALDALEYTISMNKFKGFVTESNKLMFDKPYAFILDPTIGRDLLFKPISSGALVIGDFNNRDFVYDGYKNLLSIRCTRIFQNYGELTGEYIPYVIVGPGDFELGNLRGVQIDIVPKHMIGQNVSQL